MKVKYIFLLLILIACKTKKTSKKEIKLFYIFQSQNIDKLDTIPYNKKNIISKDDTLIHQEAFKYYGKYHVINMTTNQFKAGIDGGEIRYKLDDLGVIYKKSTTWYSYMRLVSDNDSLNNLIDRALENIFLHKEFTCLQLDTFKMKERTITFLK